MSDHDLTWVRFDDMTWPNPRDPREIQWQLRYSLMELNRSDQLVAASILAAYFALVDMTEKRRRPIVRQLQRSYRAPSPTGEKP